MKRLRHGHQSLLGFPSRMFVAYWPKINSGNEVALQSNENLNQSLSTDAIASTFGLGAQTKFSETATASSIGPQDEKTQQNVTMTCNNIINLWMLVYLPCPLKIQSRLLTNLCHVRNYLPSTLR